LRLPHLREALQRLGTEFLEEGRSEIEVHAAERRRALHEVGERIRNRERALREQIDREEVEARTRLGGGPAGGGGCARASPTPRNATWRRSSARSTEQRHGCPSTPKSSSTRRSGNRARRRQNVCPASSRRASTSLRVKPSRTSPAGSRKSLGGPRTSSSDA